MSKCSVLSAVCFGVLKTHTELCYENKNVFICSMESWCCLVGTCVADCWKISKINKYKCITNFGKEVWLFVK